MIWPSITKSNKQVDNDCELGGDDYDTFGTLYMREFRVYQLLLKRCSNKVEKAEALLEADQYSESVIPYSPTCDDEMVSYVSLDNAIACINK